MIIHFLRFLLRSLWKQRFYTALNLVGLVMGLSVSFIIYLYVDREFSVDRNIAVSPNTYRLLRVGDLNGSPYLIGVTSGPFAEALPVDFPQDVEKAARVMKSDRWVRYEDKVFYEDNFNLTDSTFFDVFALDLAQGNKKTALTGINNVVITKRMVKKYFGEADPMNKVIRVSDRYDLVVTGVLEEPTDPNHLQINFLGNIELMRDRSWFSNWWNNNMITYVVLKEGSNYQNVNSQLPAFMDKYFGKDFAANKNRMDVILQPIDEAYFENNVRYDSIPHGNFKTIYIFSGIGVFILIIALINFINLATAKSVSRAREVGLKKTMGSTRSQLIFQFLFESLIITGVALALSLMIVEVLLPLFNDTYNLSLVFTLTPLLAVKLVVFLVGISILAGLYPAFVISSFNAVKILKGNMKSGPGAVRFRKALVIMQFAISTFILIGTFIVAHQLDYIHSKSLGFDKEAVIIIEMNNRDIYAERESFRNLLSVNPSVQYVSFMGGEPGGFHDTMTMRVEGREENARFRTNFVDYDFANTFNLTFSAGRNFSRDFSTDPAESVIINEAGAKELGWTPEEALGKKMMVLMMDTIMKTVIGVVKDFHFSSLKTPIEPLVLGMTEDGGNIAVKVNANNIPNTLAEIENSWKKIVPQYPFQFQFLDDRLTRLYKSEELQGNLFSLFSFVSIIVAALGIIGLATYSSMQRQMEVGVRKVLGASGTALSILLMKDLLQLTFIAALLAWPFAYWMTTEWLSSFAYRIEPSLWYFIVATLLTLSIAISSISYQAIKVARVNPVDVLKEN